MKSMKLHETLTTKVFAAFALLALLTVWLAAHTASWATIPLLLGAVWIFSVVFVRSLQPAFRRITETAQTAVEQVERRLQDLEAQRNQAQAILESMVEGVLALDAEGRVLWLNGSAQRLFGITPRQATGKRFTELFRHPEIDGLMYEALKDRRLVIREVHTFAPRAQAVRFQAAPCEGGATTASLVLVAQDVTEMRRLEGMRREFVANVSHELKTPLTSIKSLVETLLNGALDDPANNRRFVSLIDEDATRLARLIDDLLELSSIESKALPLKREPVALRAMVTSIVTSLQRNVDQRRLTVALEIPPELSVQADADRLRQVFLNLIDNAVKYNKDGGRITVGAARDNGSLVITVADTGVGIPPQDLTRIFERFYRVDKARSRALGGTGLGLSIVKHIVEAHGGRVTVRSQPGQGSAFTFTLPL